MQIHNKVANDLYGVLAKKFTKLTIADSQAVTTVEPSEGRIFTLEYGASGKSYGSVTVNVVDPNSLVVYYNTNISEDIRSTCVPKFAMLASLLSICWAGSSKNSPDPPIS